MAQQFTSLEDIQAAMEKFKGGGGNRLPFFSSLKNDSESVVVRFMHTGPTDLNIRVAHKVKINDKERWVLCTNDDSCPVCQAGNAPTLKMFLVVYNYTSAKVELWERGKTFIPKMLNLCKRYPNLNKRDFEIIRNGAKGDQGTTYDIFPMDETDTALPERPEVFGNPGFVLELSVVDLKKVANGTYTPPVRGGGEAGAPGRSGTDLF